MASYHYRVRDTGGQLLEGEVDAPDERDARKRLEEKQYFLIDFRQAEAKRAGPSFSFGGGRVGTKDLSLFSWQLHTMVNAGMPLIEALKLAGRQAKHPGFQRALEDVTKRVEQGGTFSDALKAQPSVFSPLYVHMVQAGEASGALDEILKRLAMFLERQAEIEGKIKGAMAYPMILAIASLGVATFLVGVVLPRFVGMFQEMGAQLPLPTIILLNLSHVIRAYWYLIILGVGGLVAALRWYIHTPQGSLFYGRGLLILPVIGQLQTKVVAARFAQTLSILAGSGLPILTGLEITKLTVGNAYVSKSLEEVAAQVAKGSSIAAPMDKLRVFPEMVVNMIRVGEETGALDKMLERVTNFYEREVNAAIETFTKLIEPVFLIVMTCVIGFIAVSIFMPMADIMSAVG